KTDSPWTPHATATLTTSEPSTGASGADAAQPDLRSWPPPGSVPAPVDGLYPRLAQLGLHYGPTFRGLRRAWLRDDEIFVEVELPDELADDASRFAVHPALLDAALHGLALRGFFDGEDGGPRLPFSWSGVRLHTTGARTLRVRLAPAGADSVSIQAADENGDPVAEVDALVVRPVALDQLAASTSTSLDDLLLRVGWQPLALTVPASDVPDGGVPNGGVRWVLLGDDDPGLRAAWESTGLAVSAVPDVPALGDAIAAGTLDVEVVALSLRPTDASRPPVEAAADPQFVPTQAGATTQRVLEILQSWLGDERLAHIRLVLVTQSAVTTGTPDETADLITAPVWGLVRSAQRESPGRFVLVDVDDRPDSLGLVPSVVASDEEQAALRAGAALVPRLERAAPIIPAPRDGAAVPSADGPAFDPEGTVLITGGTGTLGALL
ncbi:polyketide synthase dehydratase domain-containing protein, partial [Frankia sp. Ag45/Mut15]